MCQGFYQYFVIWTTCYVIGIDMINISPSLRHFFLTIIVFDSIDIYFKMTQQRMMDIKKIVLLKETFWIYVRSIEFYADFCNLIAYSIIFNYQIPYEKYKQLIIKDDTEGKDFDQAFLRGWHFTKIALVLMMLPKCLQFLKISKSVDIL
jgi:hypothetical protein